MGSDFFSEKPLDRQAMQAVFPFLSRSTVLQDEPNSLGILVSCPSPDAQDTRRDAQRAQVMVSFFGAISFGRVGEPDMKEDRVLQAASLDDLMATKLKVILQRAESKDDRDIAQMIRAGADLSRGLAAARAMFGPNFQPSESLKALVYFEDGDLRSLARNEKVALVKVVGAVRELPDVAILSRQLAASTDSGE